MPELQESAAKPVEPITPAPVDIAALLRDNIAKNERILQEVTFIRKHIRWQQFWGTLRFFLIIIPIILAVLYGFFLPPEVRETLDYYRSIFQP